MGFDEEGEGVEVWSRRLTGTLARSASVVVGFAGEAAGGEVEAIVPFPVAADEAADVLAFHILPVQDRWVQILAFAYIPSFDLQNFCACSIQLIHSILHGKTNIRPKPGKGH